MPSRCSNCGDMDYSDLGDMPCSCAMQARQQPQPTVEDYCESDGHVLDQDDHGVKRCYCGQRSDLVGDDDE